MTCKLCGAPFERKTRPCGGKTRQLYCSAKCQQRRYRISLKGRISHRSEQRRHYYKSVGRPIPLHLALADSLHATRTSNSSDMDTWLRGYSLGAVPSAGTST